MCTLLYYSKAPSIIKASALTVFVITGLIIYSHYIHYLGTPITGYPDYEFVYVHHEIRGETVLLWIQKTSDLTSRLYSFEYDREVAKKLQQAQASKAQGIKVSGEFKNQSRSQAPGLDLDAWKGRSNTFVKQ